MIKRKGEKMLPKVKFEFVNLKKESKELYHFCKVNEAGWDWSKYIFQFHPLLKNKLKPARTEKEKFEITKNYTKSFWKKEYEQLKSQRNLYQKEWNKINDKYMKALSEVMETKWTKSRKIIHAQISINTIASVFPEDWSFLIFYLSLLSFIRQTVAHETIHFLYFKKWKEVFPETNKKAFDPPCLEWALSEILAPVILGDERIQKIIKCNPGGYPEYHKTKIGNKTIIQYFENLYKQSRKKNEPFAQFLKTAYKEAQKHRDKILNA